MQDRSSFNLDPERRTQQLMDQIRLSPIVAAFAVLFFSGCYYDNEETLYGPDCDLSNSSFEQTILPIIRSNCQAPACHGQGSENGEIVTYEQVKFLVDNGTFRDAVVVSKRMPQGGTLSRCDLDLIEQWLNAGAQNN